MLVIAPTSNHLSCPININLSKSDGKKWKKLSNNNLQFLIIISKSKFTVKMTLYILYHNLYNTWNIVGTRLNRKNQNEKEKDSSWNHWNYKTYFLLYWLVFDKAYNHQDVLWTITMEAKSIFIGKRNDLWHNIWLKGEGIVIFLNIRLFLDIYSAYLKDVISQIILWNM